MIYKKLENPNTIDEYMDNITMIMDVANLKTNNRKRLLFENIGHSLAATQHIEANHYIIQIYEMVDFIKRLEMLVEQQYHSLTKKLKSKDELESIYQERISAMVNLEAYIKKLDRLKRCLDFFEAECDIGDNI